eukprot:Amastigsp_a3948_5.p2 type:complete len:141 gc:universal Amastigsp_a3948_5:268-690(+)
MVRRAPLAMTAYVMTAADERAHCVNTRTSTAFVSRVPDHVMHRPMVERAPSSRVSRPMASAARTQSARKPTTRAAMTRMKAMAPAARKSRTDAARSPVKCEMSRIAFFSLVRLTEYCKSPNLYVKLSTAKFPLPRSTARV